MPYVYAACAACVTIFKTGSKFRPVSNFTELHALTVAARSYVLLADTIKVGLFMLYDSFPRLTPGLRGYAYY